MRLRFRVIIIIITQSESLSESVIQRESECKS